MSNDKIDLIAKLLAKAESTTPEEAEALTEHAERLILKYGIEQAQLDSHRAQRGEAQEQIVTERMLFTGVYARDLREIGIGVAGTLGAVRPLIAELPPTSILYLVGCSSDVRQSMLLTASLQVQATVAMRAWWADARDAYSWASEGDRRRARSGFLRGFAGGVVARMTESRKAAVEDAGAGTELVLASRRERVDDAVARMHTRRARPRGRTDSGAYMDGHRSGREANTGEKPVGAGRGNR
jgi:hypothetical protein